jgi:hypothetical protein
MSEVNQSSTNPVTTAQPVSEQSSPESNQKPQNQETKAAQELRKFKLKVDGREEELDEEAVIRYASKGKAADKRFEEAAQMRREAEQFVSMLKKDPIKVLSDPKIGHDFRMLAEEYLAKQLEQELMSPEQRKAREMETKLREYEERERVESEQKRQSEMQQLEARAAEDYSKKITSALEMGGVPKTARTVKRMAELMHKNLAHGFDLEPAHLAEMVREDYLNEIKELFGASDGDTLLKLLGDDNSKKIRQADLNRLKTQKPVYSSGQSKPALAPSQTNRKMGTLEWREEIAKIKKGQS